MKIENPIEEVMRRGDIAVKLPIKNPLMAWLLLAAPVGPYRGRVELRSIGTLAKALNTGKATVYQWINRQELPLHRAQAVAAISADNGGLVSFDDLAPYITTQKAGRPPKNACPASLADAEGLDAESKDLL